MPTMLRRGICAAITLFLAVVLAPSAPAEPVTAAAWPMTKTAEQKVERDAEQRIVGGESASVRAHPYAVYLTDRSGTQFCGGTLISRSTVLTAAHCVRMLPASAITVVIGRQDKRTTDGVEVDVTRAWVPSGYQGPLKGGDLAVLELTEDVPYRPAGIPPADDQSLYSPGTEATVLGWGRLSEGGPKSATLRQAQVPLMNDSTCRQAYTSYDERTMVCAGYPQGGVDACQGDSGGPLLVDGVVIGIVSWGEGCGDAGKPGVYTRVSAYADLLNRMIRMPGDREAELVSGVVSR